MSYIINEIVQFLVIINDVFYDDSHDYAFCRKDYNFNNIEDDDFEEICIADK